MVISVQIPKISSTEGKELAFFAGTFFAISTNCKISKNVNYLQVCNSLTLNIPGDIIHDMFNKHVSMMQQ